MRVFAGKIDHDLRRDIIKVSFKRRVQNGDHHGRVGNLTHGGRVNIVDHLPQHVAHPHLGRLLKVLAYIIRTFGPPARVHGKILAGNGPAHHPASHGGVPVSQFRVPGQGHARSKHNIRDPAGRSTGLRVTSYG